MNIGKVMEGGGQLNLGLSKCGKGAQFELKNRRIYPSWTSQALHSLTWWHDTHRLSNVCTKLSWVPLPCCFIRVFLSFDWYIICKLWGEKNARRAWHWTVTLTPLTEPLPLNLPPKPTLCMNLWQVPRHTIPVPLLRLQERIGRWPCSINQCELIYSITKLHYHCCRPHRGLETKC
jgi:hypothetical protein